MFVSGTVKYAERTWALKMATAEAIKDSRMGDLYKALRKFEDPKGDKRRRRRRRSPSTIKRLLAGTNGGSKKSTPTSCKQPATACPTASMS
jgi:hypothetical protein